MPLELKCDDRGIYHMHGTVAGQRVRESTKTRDPASAERIRAETEARLHKIALYGPEKETTFGEACLLYLIEKRKEARRNRGEALEQNGDVDPVPPRYLLALLKHFGKRKVATISPGELKRLATKLYPKAKNSTLNRSVLKPFRAVVNFAAESHLCQRFHVDGFAEADVIRDAGDWDWIDAFRAHAPNDWLRALALFMFSTAARIGECVKMQPHHLDLDNKRAYSPKATKNGHPRIYYLTDDLVRELRLLKPRAVNYGRGPLRVFGYADHHGTRVPWKQTCERAGIAHLTPHEAGRAGFATEMIQRKKQDVKTTAALGNWKDPNVMMQRYVKHAELHAAAEANFGEGRGDSGATLKHAPAARLKVVGEKK